MKALILGAGIAGLPARFSLAFAETGGGEEYHSLLVSVVGSQY